MPNQDQILKTFNIMYFPWGDMEGHRDYINYYTQSVSFIHYFCAIDSIVLLSPFMPGPPVFQLGIKEKVSDP